MYDYATPQKLLDALRFLKTNNPLYADIDVNEQWVEAAMANNEELCKHLVGHNDEDMDTECEQPENDVCDNSSHTNVAVDEESDPMEHDNSDEFTTALCQLKVLAQQNNFAIHDVPYDGNCMFSAVSYQLQTTGVCNIDSSALREKVADHFEANAPLYCGFLSQPVSSDDSYNADTDQPTAEDEYINSVPDPQLQTELKWRKYLRCLRQGAWGDHITMQGIADMLCVKTNVLSSHHSILSVAPGTGSAECEISVGQYFYINLETCGSNVEQNAQPTTLSSHVTENAPVADETLDDATIEEGVAVFSGVSWISLLVRQLYAGFNGIPRTDMIRSVEETEFVCTRASVYKSLYSLHILTAVCEFENGAEEHSESRHSSVTSGSFARESASLQQKRGRCETIFCSHCVRSGPKVYLLSPLSVFLQPCK